MMFEQPIELSLIQIAIMSKTLLYYLTLNSNTQYLEYRCSWTSIQQSIIDGLRLLSWVRGSYHIRVHLSIHPT